MNNPTREEFDELKEEVRQLRELTKKPKKVSARCVGCEREVFEAVDVNLDLVTHEMQCLCKECAEDL